MGLSGVQYCSNYTLAPFRAMMMTSGLQNLSALNHNLKFCQLNFISALMKLDEGRINST